MTDQKIDPNNAARLAREILEQTTEKRVDAVRSIIAATNALDNAERRARDTRDAHGRAWADAIASGWSDKDLRATGVRPPLKSVAPSRARRTNRAVASGGDEGS